MFITKKNLSRRTVLKGLGATIGLPLLDAMVPAATALAQTSAAPMPRLGFVYVPHGAVEERWVPDTAGTEFEFKQILEPLAPFREHVTIVSGLRNKAGESPSPHAITAGTWLNCAKPALQHSPLAGTSADQIAVEHIGGETPFPSLELCTDPGGPCDPGYGCGYGHTISFRTPTQPLPMEYNPRKLFYQLFGQGDTPEERVLIVGETRSILDSISLDARSLQDRLTAPDRNKVGDYLDAVREIERRIQTMEQRDISSLELPGAPVGVPADFNAHLDLMFDLIALAYQANLTRVVTFMMGKEVSMRTFNNVGVPDAFHPLSHHGNNEANKAKLATVQTFHAQVFARFVEKLAGMPDGDGSMLDHTVMLYGSNMSNSNEHNNDPLPSVLVGRAYGSIKGGQHLAYPQDTPLANVMLTILDRVGVPVDSIGDSTGQFSEV